MYSTSSISQGQIWMPYIQYFNTYWSISCPYLSGLSECCIWNMQLFKYNDSTHLCLSSTSHPEEHFETGWNLFHVPERGLVSARNCCWQPHERYREHHSGKSSFQSLITQNEYKTVWYQTTLKHKYTLYYYYYFNIIYVHNRNMLATVLTMTVEANCDTHWTT